jgi:hypothetical protein
MKISNFVQGLRLLYQGTYAIKREEVLESLSIPKAVYIIKGKKKEDKDVISFKLPKSKRLNGRIIASYSFNSAGVFRSITMYWMDKITSITHIDDKKE